MGLDQYLYLKDESGLGEGGEELIYWRKANAIHKWFVDNLANGNDVSLEPVTVTRDDLEALRKVCLEVLDATELVEGDIVAYWTYDENGREVPHYEPGRVLSRPDIAEKLLPTQSGFFFGDVAYTEYYLEDVQHTADAIARVLADHEPGYEFVYVAWW